MAFRSSTTAGDSTGTTLTIAIPSGATTNDILIMHFYGEVNLGLTPTFDVGSWTKITAASGQQLGETTDFEVYRYWARWDTTSGNIVISWGGASIWRSAICAAFSGRIQSGDPQDATATFNAAGSAGTTATALGLTTGHTNADLIMLESDVQGSTHNTWSFPLTEQADFGGQGLAAGAQAASGASGDKTVSIASAFWTGALIALREIPAGPAITSQPSHNSVISGQPALFSVSATSSGGTLHYQWKLNGSNVGPDSADYARPAVIPDDGASISCDVSDDNGTTSSSSATLGVRRTKNRLPVQHRP